jgi:hypothetical protein
MDVTLAEALLRRKELSEKVKVLKNFKENQLFYQIRGERKKVTEGLDDISADFPRMQAGQVTREHDWHARQLRLIDAAIQQANWTTKIPIDDSIMSEYKEPPKEEKERAIKE